MLLISNYEEQNFSLLVLQKLKLALGKESNQTFGRLFSTYPVSGHKGIRLNIRYPAVR